MPQTIDRDGARTRPREDRRRRHGGPVVLVTFDHARFEADAARFAVEAAADMRSTLTSSISSAPSAGPPVAFRPRRPPRYAPSTSTPPTSASTSSICPS